MSWGGKTTTQPFENDADACRSRGWLPGTRLAGDEGYGVTVIEITALGTRKVLARVVSHAGRPNPRGSDDEGSWTLSCRDWVDVSSDGQRGDRGGGCPQRVCIVCGKSGDWCRGPVDVDELGNPADDGYCDNDNSLHVTDASS